MTPQHLDTVAAFVDGVNAAMGNPQRLPHPNSDIFLDRPLSTFAEYCGQKALAERNDRTARPRQAVLGAGIATGDFQNTLSAGAKKYAVTRYQHFAEHLSITADQPVKIIGNVEFPNGDIDIELAESGEGAEVKAVRAGDVAGQTASLKFYQRSLTVSRPVVINDDVGMLKHFFGALGSGASKKEGQLVAAVLEENPTLGDGAPMYGTDNSVAEALSASSLDSAARQLRLQVTAAGNLANLKLARLVVAAGLEVAARKILRDSGLENEVKVVCLPWLPAGRWFGLADPAVSPTIGRLVLAGGGGSAPIDIGPVSNKTTTAFDGLVLKGTAILGAVALGRVGIVKGGA
ncbi:MAG: hypothetical protein HZC22_10370 [Rhodocyclales bacterium]|nr:hypothetical protein [Rhodocyclales bacterium]